MECFPPSEKESGVRFNTAISRVLRFGFKGFRGGIEGDSGAKVRTGELPMVGVSVDEHGKQLMCGNTL